MNVAIAIIGTFGLAASIYAICHPHWPNGAALAAMWQCVRLMGCRHSARCWRIERVNGRVQMHCVACRKHHQRPLITRAV